MDGNTLVEAHGQSPERMESYEWTFPGSPVRVRLKLDIVPGILDHLMQGWQEERPREAGGILLGEISGNCVEISGFDPFFCAQQPGSLFVVRDQDLVRVQECIGRWNHPARSSKAVGYFRSQMSGTLSLHDDDVALIDAAFQNPFDVFLLVKPAHGDTWPTADFFFRDGEKVFTESILPFPFDQNLLETEARSVLQRFEEALEDQVPQVPLQLASIKQRRRYRTLAFTAFILLTVALFSTLLPRKPAPVPDGKPLALVARHQQAEVTIGWDPAVPAIRNARIGMLSLHDDAKQEEIPLPVTALRTGQFVYKTEGKPLRITLEVFSPEGQRTREMITVSGDATAHAHAVAQTPTPPPSLVKPTPTTNTQTEPPVALSARNPPTQFQMPEKQGNDPMPASIFAMEPPSLDHKTGVQTQAFPPIAALITPAASATPPVAATAPPPADSAQVPPPKEPVVAPPSQAPQVRLSPPVVATVSPVPAATPPKPIQQTRPELPANLRNLLQNEVLVQVHVMIDATGRVTKATTAPARSTIAEYAGKAAATAARLWRFEPSRRDGQPVSSEMVLEFRFAPTPKTR